jgi:hypothetical protein
MRSAAIFSRSARSAAMRPESGTRMVARAWNKVPPPHRGADALGRQFLDVGLVGGQHGRHLPQDAGPILADEFERDHRTTGWPGRLLAGMDNHPQTLDLQSLQRALQVIRPVGGRLHPDDSGKLPSKMAHPALQPVAAPIGHAGGDQLH